MKSRAGRLSERLLDIREAINNVRDDLGNLSKEQFLADGKTQRAVIESLIVIGEAANSIMRQAPNLEQSSPELWQHFRDVYDMRIVLTHEYFRVDAAVVWETVYADLPRLESLLRGFSLGGDGSGGGATGDARP
ncbi:MAG: HepT-like ribonuclease domain-containing protein [Propionivibrio sp.]